VLGTHVKVTSILAFFFLLASPVALAADMCAYDLKAMLALNEDAFDQDLANGGGGWRAIGNTPGCELAAADLLAAYRASHPKSSAILAWHEGQMRATAGQYQRAISLLSQDRKPQGQDPAGWNLYVDATLAFLRNDKPALLKAREELAAVPYPQGAGFPPVIDGYFEIPTMPGQPAARMRWPPNIEAIDGLIACFGKPYAEAYGLACRRHGS
jgi:hypothetical protein